MDCVIARLWESGPGGRADEGSILCEVFPLKTNHLGLFSGRSEAWPAAGFEEEVPLQVPKSLAACSLAWA